VASGLNNHDSALQLGISMATLKGYLQNIYQKLGITNRKELNEHIIAG
jgi:DNA-binding NarL/FixJ family response regulator